jgi:hypothetical protein
MNKLPLAERAQVLALLCEGAMEDVVALIDARSPKIGGKTMVGWKKEWGG